MKRIPIFVLLIVTLIFGRGCGIDEQAKQKASIHYNLGLNQLQQGNSSGALQELLEAEKLNPKDPAIHHALGMAYNAKGRFPQGLDQLQQALKLDPKNTEVHNALGATYLEMGQWDEAIREFEIVLKDLLYLTPYYPMNSIGWAYQKKGDPAKALEYHLKAVAMNPNFGLAYYHLGLAYKALNQDEKAISAFHSAVSSFPHLLDAHFQLGLLHLKAGNREEARKSFQEVVRIAPQSESAKLAQQYLDLMQKPAGK